MGNYIKLFNTVSEQIAFRNSVDYVEPHISCTKDGKNLKYNKDEYKQLVKTPLTFVIESDGDIMFRKIADGDPAITLEYSKNEGEWTTIISDYPDNAPTISVVTGDTVAFRAPSGGNTAIGMALGFNHGSTFGSPVNGDVNKTTCNFSLRGNIMSLLYHEDFDQELSLSTEYSFASLFNGCTGLTHADKLMLPATELSNYCYYGMFQGCSSLVSAPKLPALILKKYCYGYMFAYCYLLVDAPVLLAETLVDYCYSNMFAYCSNLDYLKCMATDISAAKCTASWLRNAATTGTFIKKPSVDWSASSAGIPSGWTIINSDY